MKTRGTPESDRIWLAATTRELDNMVIRAANAAGVNVIDAYGAFAGHELCTSDVWANPLLSTSSQSEWFHPNAEGYAAWANLVINTVRVNFGGVDLNGYCQARGYDAVSLDGSTAYDWHCDSGGTRYNIDMVDACGWQYGATGPWNPSYRDFNDPYSWECWRGNGAPQLSAPPPSQELEVDHGGMDLNGYCQARGYDGVSLDTSSVFGWHCDSGSARYDIDMVDACNYQYGAAEWLPRYRDPNDPSSWSCWLLASAPVPGHPWIGPVNQGMGPLGSTPSVAVRPGGEQDVFWKGTDDDLWGGRWVPGTGWEGPIHAGFGPLGSEPSAAAWGDNLDVVWKGTDGGLWGAQFDGTQWNGPISLASMGTLGSRPTIDAYTDGSLAVFWQGTDGNLWTAWWHPDGKGWQGPANVGVGQIGSAPTATVRPSGEQDVFWRGTDGDLWGARYVNGAWQGPIHAGFGPLGSEPAAAAWGTNLDVVWRGTDGGLWGAQFDGHNWNGPLNVPGMGPLGSLPTIGAHPNGELDVFWTETDGNLWEGYWVP